MSGSAVLTQVGLIARYAWSSSGQPQVADLRRTSRSRRSAAVGVRWQSAHDLGGRHKQQDAEVNSPLGAGQDCFQGHDHPPIGGRRPMPVILTGSRGQVRGGIATGPKATLKFAPMRTRSLRFWFTPPTLPLQITDIQVPGVRSLISGGLAPFTLPCGFGPRIQINGQSIPTRATGTYADVLTGQPVHFAACDAVPVSAGINRVIEPSWDAFDVQSVVLDTPGDQAFTQGSAVKFATARVISWTSSSRVLRVAASQPSYLVVNENFNRGWTASIDHRALKPLRLDGWKQAWALPAGTAGIVTLTFSPDATYQANLLAAFGAIVVVFAVALVPARRRRRRRGRHQADAAAPGAPTEPLAPERPAGAPRPRRAIIASANALLLGAGAVSSRRVVARRVSRRPPPAASHGRVRRRSRFQHKERALATGRQSLAGYRSAGSGGHDRRHWRSASELGPCRWPCESAVGQLPAGPVPDRRCQTDRGARRGRTRARTIT